MCAVRARQRSAAAGRRQQRRSAALRPHLGARDGALATRGGGEPQWQPQGAPASVQTLRSAQGPRTAPATLAPATTRSGGAGTQPAGRSERTSARGATLSARSSRSSSRRSPWGRSPCSSGTGRRGRQCGGRRCQSGSTAPCRQRRTRRGRTASRRLRAVKPAGRAEATQVGAGREGDS